MQKVIFLATQLLIHDFLVLNMFVVRIHVSFKKVNYSQNIIHNDFDIGFYLKTYMIF
jgi:hypothetical protein